MCASQGKKMYFMLGDCVTWALYKIFYKMKPQLPLLGNGVFIFFRWWWWWRHDDVMKTLASHQLTNQPLCKHLLKIFWKFEFIFLPWNQWIWLTVLSYVRSVPGSEQILTMVSMVRRTDAEGTGRGGQGQTPSLCLIPSCFHVIFLLFLKLNGEMFYLICSPG